MTKNLKKRLITSLVLLSFLYLMIINNYLLGYFLMIIGILSFLEFSQLIFKIYKKTKIRIIMNLLFITYIFILFAFFLFFSFYPHLKIIIFTILITCIASDIGGFVVGKIVKGKKLTKISPNKTISGAIGSLIFSSFFISAILFYMTERFDLLIILVGCITSIFCQIGDLFISFLKRKSNLKDTGNFLPGHGGILDRIDGIILGIPFGFLALIIFY